MYINLHCNGYDVFSSLYSHHHVSTAIAAIFRVMLREYIDTNVCELCRRHSVRIKNYYTFS
jgi:hypothetical protein